VAFDRLVKDYTPLLMGFLIGRTAELQDAEDIAQETWLSAYKILPSLRRPDRLKPWLLRIAGRRVADFYRERNRRPQVVWQIEESAGRSDWSARTADPGPDPARHAQNSQVRSVVIESINRMKERYRPAAGPETWDRAHAPASRFEDPASLTGAARRG